MRQKVLRSIKGITKCDSSAGMLLIECDVSALKKRKDVSIPRWIVNFFVSLYAMLLTCSFSRSSSLG